MSDAFTVFAVVGGTLFICQLLLSAFGIGHGHDGDMSTDHDGSTEAHAGHDSSLFFGLLTVKGAIAASTMFGLVGKAALASGWTTWAAMPAALICAFFTLIIVGLAMKMLFKLQDDGTVRIERAVGEFGTVYLAIPAAKGGQGKVTIKLQNRTMEYKAITMSGALKTGEKVFVLDVIGTDTLLVEAEDATRTASRRMEKPQPLPQAARN